MALRRYLPEERVRAILLNPLEEIILIKREKPGVETYWTFPGGKVERTDPSLEQALIREIKEEVGGEAYIGEKLFSLRIPGLIHFFKARILTYDPLKRSGPEMTQIEEYTVESHPLEMLNSLNIKPQKAVKALLNYARK